MLSIDLDICHIVLENGGDVDLGKFYQLIPVPDVSLSCSIFGYPSIITWWFGRGGRGIVLTSGKVPLEKTLVAIVSLMKENKRYGNQVSTED